MNDQLYERCRNALVIFVILLTETACGPTKEEIAVTSVVSPPPTTTSTAPPPTLTATQIPPTSTPSPTNTPLPPTPTPLSLESYLDTYCGPEISSWKNWAVKEYSSFFHSMEGTPTVQLICDCYESYYFAVSGFNPGEFLMPAGVQVKSPTDGYLSLNYSHSITDEEGNFIMEMTFEGIEPQGDWELTLVGNEGSEASTSFTYMPLAPQIVFMEEEIDEEGNTTYWVVTTGWRPGETLQMHGDSPYGKLNTNTLGEANQYGYYGLIGFPTLPPDPLDGLYTVIIEGENTEVLQTFTCQEFECVFDASPGEKADEFYQEGFAQYQLENYTEAIHFFEQVLELNPVHVKALNQMAWTLIYNLDDEYEKALNLAQRAVEIQPDRHNLDTLALVHFKLKEYSDALFYYDIALFFDVEQAGSYRRRGDVYYELGELEAALSDYDKYLSLLPDAEDKDEVKKRIQEIQGTE